MDDSLHMFIPTRWPVDPTYGKSYASPIMKCLGIPSHGMGVGGLLDSVVPLRYLIERIMFA